MFVMVLVALYWRCRDVGRGVGVMMVMWECNGVDGCEMKLEVCQIAMKI